MVQKLHRVLCKKLVRWAARQIAMIMKGMKRTPKERRLGEDRAFIDFVAMTKQHWAGRGLTMAEAEEQIAAARGWSDRETLLRMLRKAKARLRQRAAK
jgi:hypothetical protein